MRTTRPLPVVVLAVAVLLTMTGCGGLSGLMPVERGGTAADPRALALAWSTPATQPDWIPGDARGIRWVARTMGGADTTPAAVRLRSTEALPDDCREDAEARTAAITAAWAPEVAAHAVRRCGNWAVAAVDGGYYGWTPVAAPAS